VISVSATKGDGAYTIVDKLKELLQAQTTNGTTSSLGSTH
jgi:hypothetical protein